MIVFKCLASPHLGKRERYAMGIFRKKIIGLFGVTMIAIIVVVWVTNSNWFTTLKLNRDRKAFNDSLNKFWANEEHQKLQKTNAIPAEVLFDRYKDNSVRADVEYKNKEVVIGGIVKTVRQDNDSKCYMVLVTDEYGTKPIICLISRKQALEVSADEQLYAVGECLGVVRGEIIIQCNDILK